MSRQYRYAITEGIKTVDRTTVRKAGEWLRHKLMHKPEPRMEGFGSLKELGKKERFDQLVQVAIDPHTLPEHATAAVKILSERKCLNHLYKVAIDAHYAVGNLAVRALEEHKSARRLGLVALKAHGSTKTKFAAIEALDRLEDIGEMHVVYDKLQGTPNQVFDFVDNVLKNRVLKDQIMEILGMDSSPEVVGPAIAALLDLGAYKELRALANDPAIPESIRNAARKATRESEHGLPMAHEL
jgi:hypothetical protein